jgi:DNA-binding CsgD family transcriptional regulator
MIDVTRLTLKEIEILRLISVGYLNKQIAAELRISEQTAKNYMTRILRKLDAVNRTEAVVKAAIVGLVPLDRDS